VEAKKLIEFLREPEQNASGWIQTAILKSGTSVIRLANQMNRKQDILYKWANPQDLERNFPLCYLPLLIRETGDLSILDELNAMFGRVAIPKDAWTLITQGVEQANGEVK